MCVSRCGFWRVYVCDWAIESLSSSAQKKLKQYSKFILDVLVLKRFAVTSKATSPRKLLALQTCQLFKKMCVNVSLGINVCVVGY